MRIAIVNDMVLAVEALRRVVSSVPGYDIAWIARDGAEAVQKCASDNPDLILMDLIMPVMDGVEATRRIMQESPCAILVVTATVTGNASKVFDAMGYGALDAVNTPVLGASNHLEGAAPLLEKISTIGKLIGKPAKPPFIAGPAASPKTMDGLQPLIVIGASTGGPLAIARILSALPENFTPPIVIVQHVDLEFVTGLANWLGEQSRLPVRPIREGESPAERTVLLAATQDHLILTPSLTLRYTQHPVELPYRPSVDVFFNSVSQNWRGRVAGILLTGMGRDGAEGLLKLRESGALTIVQEKESCIVYGMPKAAVQRGAALQILPPEEIAFELIQWSKEKTGKPAEFN
jgi:two-component system response regulator WspF